MPRLAMRVVPAVAALALLATSLVGGTAAATGSDTAPDTQRISGADRYRTAVEISKAHFEDSFIAVVASGENFPDALGAGPYAASMAGPLLLVPRTGKLPAVVAAELTRLDVGIIIVAGGSGAVSDTMVAQLKSFGDVYRYAGSDRYETAAEFSFGDEGGTVFVANGTQFPDALGGGAAAGSLDAPMLLTAATTLPAATREALEFLEPVTVVVLGGTGAVSAGVVNAIKSTVPKATVVRRAGADRYTTATSISQYAHAFGSDTVYLASGDTFPDALAGSPVAGQSQAPLLLTKRNCVPAATLAEISRLGATTVIALGGTGAISDAALALHPC